MARLVLAPPHVQQPLDEIHVAAANVLHLHWPHRRVGRHDRGAVDVLPFGIRGGDVEQAPALHAARLLERLVVPSRLDEHWIGELLEWCSNMHPDLVVTFLLARFAEEGRRKGGGDYGYVARPDHLRRHDFNGIRKAPTYASALREIRDALLNPAVSSSSAVEMFWRMGQLDLETLSALDEWLHADPSRLQALVPLIRDCHDPIALQRPMFALHACQVAADVGSDAADRIASALVGNAMPTQWSGAPGTVPPAFTEIAERARRIHEMLGSVPNSDVLKRIEDEAVRRGRLAAEDY